MKYLPNVSVIVAVYNAENTIEACIDSLLVLEYPKDRREILCVNNNSTDRTEVLMKRYGNKIRILNKSKKGPAAARNHGIAHVKGEIIALTDADCLVHRVWLRELVQPLHNRAVAIVGGKILAHRPCNPIEAFGEKIHDHEKAINVYKPPYVITMNWAARLSLLQTFGYFDESFLRGSDAEFSFRVGQAGYLFVYQPEAIIYHQNEKTLRGLFHEGYVHGLHSIKVNNRHQQFVIKFGYRQWDRDRYRRLWQNIQDFVAGSNSFDAKCELIFNVGKTIGNFLGFLRFCYQAW